MNPYDEQGLRDEVLYLHSLWHQGPPPPQPNPIHLPIRTLHHHAIPFSNSQPYLPQPLAPHFHPLPLLLPHHQQQRTIYPPTPAHTRSLPPVTSTSFKKKKKNKKKKKKGSGVSDSNSHNVTIPDPGPEWPCPTSPDPPARAGWGESKPLSDPPLTVSPQEKERLAALKAQHKACQAFKEFLFGSDGEDDDDGDDSEDDDEDEEELEKFFLRIFLEGNELRGYYQRCFESGEFCCLVCDAVGKKNSGKKFKDCAGLVQHSMSILRTVKKRAHRAFGQVVCKVMGWDIDRLPTIVMKGEPLGCSVEMKQAQEEGEPKENVAAADEGGKDGSHKSDDKAVALEHGDELVEQNAQGVDQSIGECSSKEGDIDEKMLDTGLENGGGGDIYEGEPKVKVDDDGKNGNHKSDDIVVSLGHGDEPVEEHARGVDQSISECSSKEGNLNNNAENLDEKMLDIELKNGGGGAIDKVHHESLASGAEWVCKIPNCDSSSTASGWPSFNTNSSSQICSRSAEEQARVAVLQMQHKALEACQEYLVGNAGSDCDDDNDDEDEDEDELINYYDPEECEEFKFFLRLFTEDSDLRRYYENNHREGDFFCLVCGGIRKKMWKRFKDCIALLQHSTAIKRTKRKRAHRAYSQVICKVLGWDIDGLPAIVLKGESLGSSLSGSRKLPGESEKTADSDIGDSNGEPEKPVDSLNDNSNVLQENQAK